MSPRHLRYTLLRIADSNHLIASHRLILTYLIPIRLLRGSLPAPGLLRAFPRLEALYQPFLDAFVTGDVRAFDKHLSAPTTEKTLVNLGAYLSLERAREGCLRALFRRVWLARNKETRIKVSDFWTALKWVGMDVEIEEAEWFVATMIFKGYMKGYIAHERGIVVLSAKEAFPKLGSFTVAST